jgi:hypothetical protein
MQSCSFIAAAAAATLPEREAFAAAALDTHKALVHIFCIGQSRINLHAACSAAAAATLQEGEAFAAAAALDTHKVLVHIFFATRSTTHVYSLLLLFQEGEAFAAWTRTRRWCTSPMHFHYSCPSCCCCFQEGEAFAAAAALDTHKALVHIFFATRSTKKVAGVSDAGLKPRKVARVAVLGGGLMGSGIATALVLAGVDVLLKEVNQQFLDVSAVEDTKHTLWYSEAVGSCFNPQLWCLLQLPFCELQSGLACTLSHLACREEELPAHASSPAVTFPPHVLCCCCLFGLAHIPAALPKYARNTRIVICSSVPLWSTSLLLCMLLLPFGFSNRSLAWPASVATLRVVSARAACTQQEPIHHLFTHIVAFGLTAAVAVVMF